MLAQGETLGLLYVEEPPANDPERLAAARAAIADHWRIEIMVENIALALGNHRLREALRIQSIRDPLTGLFNRRYLEETLEIEFARASRAKTALSIMMIDVDHFKRFNDNFGHDAGDVVLKTVAQALNSGMRRGDITCRYGGEEFTIFAPGAALEDGERRARRPTADRGGHEPRAQWTAAGSHHLLVRRGRVPPPRCDSRRSAASRGRSALSGQEGGPESGRNRAAERVGHRRHRCRACLASAVVRNECEQGIVVRSPTPLTRG